MGFAGYKKLIVWQKADKLAKEVYLATKRFPIEERYGSTSQIRRSSLSIPTNIVEGYARKSKKELKHFLSIAIGSQAETEYLLDFCFDVGYFTANDHKNLGSLREEVGKLLWRFNQSI